MTLDVYTIIVVIIIITIIIIVIIILSGILIMCKCTNLCNMDTYLYITILKYNVQCMHTERPSSSICLTLLPLIPRIPFFFTGMLHIQQAVTSLCETAHEADLHRSHWLVDWHLPTPLCCFM